MRVAILDDYLDAALELGDWSVLEGRAELVVFNEPLGDEDTAAEALKDFDAVVGMRERTPFPASLIARLPKLKLLITTGMRNFSFDMEAARARGVLVCGTESLGYPTAELTWALILSLFRHIPVHNAAMREGRWQTVLDSGLRGKTLGVLGLGRLGAQVAAIGTAFGMEVVAWSENLSEERAVEHGAIRVEKETLFRNADVISIHLVLSARTRGLVGRPEFSLMKSTAYLVNTSRGPIVDREALIEALRSKRIAGAALDVYDIEPLPENHPLRSLDNLVLTPHVGYVTRENLARMYTQAAEDIAAFLDGTPLRVLNP